jgi:hypothetical protein
VLAASLRAAICFGVGAIAVGAIRIGGEPRVMYQA